MKNGSARLDDRLSQAASVEQSLDTRHESIDARVKAHVRQKQKQKRYKADNADKIREYQKQYRVDNAEKLRAYNKQYRTENAKIIREQKKQYSAANPDIYRAQKKYKAAHAEKLREYGKRYRAANAEKLRAQKKQHRAENAEKIRKRKQELHAANVDKDPKGTWLRKTFGRAKARARKRGLPYDEKCPDLKLPDVCPVLGIALVYPNALKNKRSPNSPSLDRLTNSRGYVAVNLRVISFRANALKNDATVGELEAVIRYMKLYKDEH
jgi:hypothetical protein